MPLNQAQFSLAINTLFDPEQDCHQPERLLESATAFQNLVLHFVEKRARSMFDYVFFDPVKIGLMLKRFCRDAYGVRRYTQMIESLKVERQITDEAATQIERVLSGLSIRINSDDPKKTRVAAAFSLWMSTMRPVFIQEIPDHQDRRLWRLEATINFWIACCYLEKFGDIQIGTPGDVDDFDQRLRRIWYDLTFRGLNLSCLEMMYASIFRPDRTLNP
jgi:hypothetical protein